jgi:hypothetical protein
VIEVGPVAAAGDRASGDEAGAGATDARVLADEVKRILAEESGISSR